MFCGSKGRSIEAIAGTHEARSGRSISNAYYCRSGDSNYEMEAVTRGASNDRTITEISVLLLAGLGTDGLRCTTQKGRKPGLSIN